MAAQSFAVGKAQQGRAVADLRCALGRGQHGLALGQQGEPAPEGLARADRVQPREVGRAIGEAVRRLQPHLQNRACRAHVRAGHPEHHSPGIDSRLVQAANLAHAAHLQRLAMPRQAAGHVYIARLQSAPVGRCHQERDSAASVRLNCAWLQPHPQHCRLAGTRNQQARQYGSGHQRHPHMHVRQTINHGCELRLCHPSRVPAWKDFRGKSRLNRPATGHALCGRGSDSRSADSGRDGIRRLNRRRPSDHGGASGTLGRCRQDKAVRGGVVPSLELPLPGGTLAAWLPYCSP